MRSATYYTPCDWLNEQVSGSVINACCTCCEYMAIMWTALLQRVNRRRKVRALLRVVSVRRIDSVVLTSKQGVISDVQGTLNFRIGRRQEIQMNDELIPRQHTS